MRKPHSVGSMLLAAMVFSLLAVLGCGVVFSRPCPSESEYIARYLTYFDSSQIDGLDYVYRGAIGGEGTIARIQFKGPVKLKPLGQTTKAESFDPAKMRKDRDVSKFKEQWTSAAGQKLPSWFDFPFGRKMRMIRETREWSNGNPSYDWTWYIDDERNVVYFCGVRG
jgi:hypothetical protein